MKRLIQNLLFLTLLAFSQQIKAIPINFGDLVQGTLIPGEKKQYTFNVVEGTLIRFGFICNDPALELISQSGDTVYSKSQTSYSNIDTQTLLNESGQYTIIVYSNHSTPTIFYLGLYQLSPPLEVNNINLDTLLQGSLQLWQKKFYTFQGTAGTMIKIGYCCNDPVMELISPSGDTVFSKSINSYSSIESQPFLYENGTYKIIVSSNDTYPTTIYYLGLYQQSPPLEVSSISLDTLIQESVQKWEKKFYTFQGTAGTMIKIGYCCNDPVMELISPSGDTVFSKSINSYSSIESQPFLYENGTYKIIVSSNDTYPTNIYYLGLYQQSPPLEVSSISLDTLIQESVQKWEKKFYTFQGTAGSIIKIGMTSNYPELELISPMGDTLFSKYLTSYSNIENQQYLNKNGTYTIIVSSNDTYPTVGYYLYLWQLFPLLRPKVLDFEENISSKVGHMAEPVTFQFSGAVEDLVLIENYTSTKSLMMMMYDGYFHKFDSISSNSSAIIERILNKNQNYYLVCYSPSNQTTNFSFTFHLLPKFSLKHFNTKKVGNFGKSTLTFEGNGFSPETRIGLVKEGNDTIWADTIGLNRYKCSALFDFNQKQKGLWNVVVDFGDTTIVVPNSVEIEDLVNPSVVIQLIGRQRVRPNQIAYYTIHYKNTGNINIYEIPLSIKLSGKGSAVLKEGWEYYEPELGPGCNYSGEDFHSESVDELTGEKRQFHCPTIPIIPPYGEGTVTFGVTMSKPTKIEVTAGSPVYGSDPDGNIVPAHDFFDCFASMGPICAQQLLGLGISAIDEVVPGFGCAMSMGGAIMENQTKMAQNRGVLDKPLMGCFAVNIAKAGLDCAISALPGDELIKKVWSVYQLATDENVLNAITTCRQAFNQGNTNSISASIVTSFDPNDKTGYRSPSGSKSFNDDNSNFTYLIDFENKASATAPAREIFIDDTLDLNSFDVNSFKTGFIQVGNKIVQPPMDDQNYEWEVDMRPENNLITRVRLTMDKLNGIAHWYMMAVDPVTDTLPEDPMVGFLPPNDSIGSGQGSVSFSINLKDGIGNGESVSNRASIIFDNNDPIITPTWTNKKDIVAPSSTMLPIVLKSDTTITLSWQGQDDPDGSGVYCYSLYVKKGTGEYEPVLNRACQNSIEYKFQEDVQYSFYVIASDSANNTELKSIVPDITFYRNTHGISDIRTTGNDLLKAYPNPSTKRAGITLEVALPNESLMSAEIIITSANGTVVKSLDHLERKMHIAGIPEGVYFINLFLNQKALESKKIILE